MATTASGGRFGVMFQSSADAHAESDRRLNSLRAGDQATWAAFVREHAPRMLSVARRFLRSECDCADAVQEAFVSAFRSLDKFEGHANVATWLYRIVVNACLMKLRANSRRRMESIEGLLPSFDDAGRHACPVNPWCDDVQARMDHGEVQQAVRDSIACLPEPYQTVIILRDIEQFDTEQTARVLETTPTNVKVRLHRARQALRTLLQPMFAVARAPTPRLSS